MKQEYYGDIDLTKLGQIVRKHNALVRKVQFKDGEHMLLKIGVFLKENADRFGNTATMKITCKRDEELEGVPYYVGDLKPASPREEKPKPIEEQQPTSDNPDLPF